MSFLEDLMKDLVWLKGHPMFSLNPNEYRADDYGSPMRKSDYGDRESRYGWEMDEIMPRAFGGSRSVDNLRPLNWRNNASRQAGRF